MHVLDLDGKRVKSFKPHTASIIDICFDTTADFVGTASIDGMCVDVFYMRCLSDSTFTRTGGHLFAKHPRVIRV